MLAVRENLLGWRLMKILIEDAETLQYLAPGGQWTKTVAKGRNFATTQAAFDEARKEPIHRFNVVLCVPQSEQLINLNHGRGKGPAEVIPV
jgi:hypothetical protein